MATDSVSNDKSDSGSKSDSASKGVDSETRDSVDKAMEAGRSQAGPEVSPEPTAQERQASQDRMQTEGQLSKSGFEARQANAGLDTAVMERPAPTTQTAPVEAPQVMAMPTAQAAVMTPATTATITLAQATTAPTTGPIGLPDVQVPNPTQAMRALTRGGVVALGAMGMDALQSLADRSAVQRSAEVMGVDLTTVEGTLAANAHAWGSFNAGFMSSAQFSGPTTEIAAQAIGLYEMENPGALGRGTRGDTATMNEIRGVVEGALQAHADGRLTPRAGELAQGWVETYPELSPEEKKLGELPGFTPERVEQFIEEYPAVDLGLPTHTGSPPVELPDTSIISTPIPAQAGPTIVTMTEAEIVEEAKSILGAEEMQRIREAAANGEPVTVEIGGRTIQYEPDLPASGMTMFGENGFLIGPEAFASEEELSKTVLHELHRLGTSQSDGGVSGDLATQETRAAQEFADRMFEEFFR